MSALFKTTIKTSSNHKQHVIITTQQIKSDINGNPRHRVQVWIDRKETTGNLWTPIIKGYRKTKDDYYIIQSHYIKEDITHFIKSFEREVQT